MHPALLILALLLTYGDAARCSLATVRGGRQSFETLVLAQALPDTVPVPTRVTDLVEDFRPPASALRGRPPLAQRFRAIRVTAGGLAILPEATFLVVPWDYDDGCTPLPWRESAQWVPPGAEVLFYVVESRPGSDPAEPVVDVYGEQSPYPTGVLWRRTHALEEGDPGRWLTAREYYELVSALPVDGADDRAAAVREGGEVFSRNVRWRTVFPGSALFARYRRPGR